MVIVNDELQWDGPAKLGDQEPTPLVGLLDPQTASLERLPAL
jgi:hypothetical protein